MVYVIIYLVGAFSTGLFLKLNYDLGFWEEFYLNDWNVDEGIYWFVILIWPITITVYSVGIIIHKSYSKLRDAIEKKLEEKKNAQDIQ